MQSYEFRCLRSGQLVQLKGWVGEVLFVKECGLVKISWYHPDYLLPEVYRTMPPNFINPFEPMVADIEWFDGPAPWEGADR